MDIITPIDTALLLCAGFGTRMGIIGKQLPKPLWPIFEQTILDYQITYLRNLKIKRIFINTHHLSNQINEYIKQKEYGRDIILLHEPVLLKSGGTIHNLLKLKKGAFSKLLVLNSDQFYFPHPEIWERACIESSRHTAVLFPLNCSLKDGYNELVVKDNLLQEIINIKNIQKNKNDSYLTFSGMGIINMDRLTYVPGVSNFWETVANYKSDQIFITSARDYHYYDFGTSQRYFETCFKVADEFDSQVNLFSRLGIAGPIMTGQKSDCYDKKVLNFSKFPFSNPQNYQAIILKSNQKTIINSTGLYFNELIDEVV
ncbi:MAG: hypothetical protein A2381_12045 [Bdellovibrionales bacterium RIFOXYB1_FULL_37_110]|nr:MAG: hypothetical protein A2181_01765 [Bdellovibrionales bacterium RIFOXYA1_FULL_38_20]OFZ52228.1 MAG: hypothetical protein A2417_05885 [Bdellovibrionales bacterium RIFOXYC1_FULL_37_79]OFZ57215.1 MAG: hypothetical protein A2381_12045 [Bdellovibrionales bacterium RIFOXYB1_FULL_37_110]OFZ65217.1 MAG: hypothetical protein A2577_04480 [Bdellovibrionales bacterium RIFOXYD1_FULL_36_51]